MKNVCISSQLVVVLALAACFAAQAEDKPAPAPAKEPPKLVIVKAVYGDLPNGNSTDVTDKVKGMVTKDGLVVEATNVNFGDPAEGTGKQLKVEYTLDGQKLEKSVAENETLKIMLTPPKLAIVKAVYGDFDNNQTVDVTDKVRPMLKDDMLSVGATNENFGDPAVGTGKKLKVEYTFDGAKKSKEAAEGETLTISDKGE
jgi:hypothetical protein